MWLKTENFFLRVKRAKMIWSFSCSFEVFNSATKERPIGSIKTQLAKPNTDSFALIYFYAG